MDMKILAGALALSLIAFAGVVFAMPNWHNPEGNWTGPTFNSTENFTGPPGPGFGCKGFGGNRAMHNDTMNRTGPCQNTTWQNATWRGPGDRQNLARPNPTEIEQFKHALQTGDYEAAKHFYDAYGIGGRLFGKLNETTFAKYSQIYNLQNELRQELGLNSQRDFGPMSGGTDQKPGFGPRFGIDCGPGSVRDMRHRFNNNNSTTTPQTNGGAQ